MPKVKTLATSRGKNYITEFGDHIFAFDRSVLFCKICEVKLKCEKRYLLFNYTKCLNTIISDETVELISTETVPQLEFLSPRTKDYLGATI
jgi:hypothetical protein